MLRLPQFYLHTQTGHIYNLCSQVHLGPIRSMLSTSHWPSAGYRVDAVGIREIFRGIEFNERLHIVHRRLNNSDKESKF